MLCYSKRMNTPKISSAMGLLAVLSLVYLLNFLDRTLIYILFPAIKKEMVLSDMQLAALGTTSFVLFYTSLGLPFGRLADRVSRRGMIAAGLVTWSLASAATSLATGFWSLFFCRVLVGIGEASLGPAAMSLLADKFPAERRATAQSVYSAGVPLGAAAAFWLGGYIGDAHGWRTAFVALGLPGVALAGIVMLLVEPKRTSAAVQRRPFLADLTTILRSPGLPRVLAGLALVAIAANSLSIWVPTWLVRERGFAVGEVGQLAGMIMATAGLAGTLGGGALADAWQRRSPQGRAYFVASLAGLAAGAWVVLLQGPTGATMIAAYAVLAFTGLGWLGPAAAEVQARVPAELRGLGIAVYFLVVNLVGYGIAPLVIGGISDRLVAPGLGQALLILPVCCIAAAGVLGASGWRSSRSTLAGSPAVPRSA